MHLSDTIYALSSGGLPSGVAIIRVSGPAVTEVVRELCGIVPEPRMATLRSIRDRNDAILDQALVLFFPGPSSFTGEDCLELQVHGGRAVVHAILSDLSGKAGLRHAEAGEFSRRAFHNGKLDLVEIEGLADLISAETEMQRRLASEQARGETSALYHNWARRLTHARAMIEAELDFADEDDVPGSVSATVWPDMVAMQSEIRLHLAGARTGMIIRDGFRIVIAGPPNAGKSSLLNCLAQRDLAIVTEIAGTTRDIISVDISLAGFAVKLSDTAGLRETSDIVEREGIRRAELALEEADLILLLSDMPGGFPQIETGSVPVIRVGTKIDRNAEIWNRQADVLISVVTEKGIAALLDAVQAHLPGLTNAASISLPSRRRQTDHLRQALAALDQSLGVDELELQSEWLRQAAFALGRITGFVDVEDLLDVIFSEFCVGK